MKTSNEDLSSSEFINTNLFKAVFNDVCLEDATFANVNLRGTAFDDVNFEGATMCNVNLSAVSIDDANYEGMKIEGILVTDLLEAYQLGKSKLA